MEKKIKFIKILTKDSYTEKNIDNTLCVFKSINNILVLVYSNQNKSIISFNLIDNKKINEMKNAHEENITNLIHYLDKSNKRDLILSVSDRDNSVKLWNINDINCLLNIPKINDSGNLLSACILNDKNQIYILISNFNWYEDMIELIKVYDYNGNKIKEINNSKENTFFIDTYHDNKLSTIFIITGNLGYSKSYDYINNKLYKKYAEKDFYMHSILNITIYNKKEKTDLIESSSDGIIRIWDFHKGLVLNAIQMCSPDEEINGICLWDNNNYLCAGSAFNKTIKLIDLKEKKDINDIKGDNKISNIKEIIHPQYGEILISQEYNGNIKLWIIQN